MPYIGKTTDGFGIRERFTYLASAGATSISGADANGKTLLYEDPEYVDVFLNGIRLKKGTDYNTSTANTIAGLAALALNDEVEVIVQDVFTLADMVSANTGGDFRGSIAIQKDSGVLSFGADKEITVTHSADTGLVFKNTNTGDDKPFTLTLQTGETDIAINDKLGVINFQAPDEGTGTDAILVAAGIEAISEGDFSSSNNATKLSFKTASSAAAAETMSLSSAGNLTVSGTFTGGGTMITGGSIIIPDDGTIGSASDQNAVAISAAGVVTLSTNTDSTSSTSGALIAHSAGFADDVFIGDDLEVGGGVIALKNTGSQSQLRLYCESSNAHYAALQAPAHSDFAGNTVLTLPATTDTIAGIASTQTFTNKTLTTPVIAEITSGSTITLNATTDIVLDAGGDEVIFKDGSTNVGHVSMDSDNLTIKSLVSDKDMIFQGNDGGSAITALTLDMSAAGEATFNAGIVIPDDGNIGSASDKDAIAISSSGVVTFSQNPVFPDGGIAIADLDIDGGTDIGAALADADLIIVDDGAGGTNRKATLSRLKTYIGASTAADDLTAGDAAVNLTTTSGDITIDAQGNDTDIIFKGTDGGSDTTFLTIDGSDAGAATFGGNVTVSGGNLFVADHITHAGDNDTEIQFEDDTIKMFAGNTNVIQMVSNACVFNQDSADIDFRFEGNGDSELLFIDAGEDNVKIGANAGNYAKLSIRNEAAGGQERGLYIELAPASGTSPNNVAVFAAANSNMTQPLVRIHHENPAADGKLIQGTVTGSNTETFYMDEDGDAYFKGNVGIGAAPAAHQLDVEEQSGGSIIAQFKNNTSSNPFGISLDFPSAAPDNNSNYFMRMEDSSTDRIFIYSDGDIYNHDGTFAQISDERIKDNITDANSQWDDIKGMRFVNYQRKDDIRQYGKDNAKVQLGLIGQELEKVSPNLVRDIEPNKSDILGSSEFGTLYTSDDAETKDGNDAVLYTEEDIEVKLGQAEVGDIKTRATHSKEVGDVKETKDKVKGVAYSILYMKSVKALQEAMARIETLESSNTALAARIKTLEDA